ncbi:bromodomain adjacent to zinc finger domain protein 2A isoform X3 [Bufo gargarizans]|uniref:bromodomain adjacent to zinc finger domain protein 2A isoform X3 n=1 Tax=Bufo gargarizans TaxID=30331 RepID=UPI001CF339AC|nr:bromodomain adjacent to zinc finger domain protein 2A isoform X3 [Bufo gargarizans]
METNNHFGSSGPPPLSSASGLKQLPQLVEPVYTNNSLVIFPQQAKGLNCDMPVNGLISPSIPTNPHGTYASDAISTSHSTSKNFDYLWKYPKSTIVIDSHGQSPHQLNGLASPLTNGPFCKGSSQDAWENSASSHPASLTITGQDLFNFSHSNVKVAAAVNETHCFSETSRSAPASPISSIQCVSVTSQSQERQQGIESNAAQILEADGTKTEAVGCSDAQTGNKISEHNGPDLATERLSPAVFSPFSAPDVGSMNDPSPPPTQLEECHVLNSDIDTDTDASENEATDESVSSMLNDREETEVGAQQRDENPLVKSPDFGCISMSDAAFYPVVGELKTPRLSRSVSVSPELGDSGVQGSYNNKPEMHKSPEGSKAEEPSAALESNSQTEIYTDNATPEPSATVPDPEEEEDMEPGEVKGAAIRRRVATPEDVRYPLLHGWKREVRIKKGSHRWQGETWYYAPCGKRMKQFPEVIKYLSKYSGPHVRREHFSFSPRMPVGDFYEERHTPEGTKWVLLKSEEIPSRILAITGKRGRPRNMEKARAKENKVKRGRGRPPKVKMIDLLSKPDAKLLRKLENQDILSDVEKVQLSKLRKKMRRKARSQEAKEAAKKLKEAKEEAARKLKEAKEEAAKKLKLRERKAKEKEEKAQKIKEAEQIEVKKNAKRKLKEKVATPPVPKPDRKQLAQQRRLEERKRQQFMLEEMKKPTEDMCLSDHQPLPDFPHVPGVVLPGSAFHHCLMTVEFLQSYGKVFGLDETKDVPSLFTLQEGLFNMGDSLWEVQDLLVKLLKVALFDPGLPSFCQSLKILGEKVSEISLTRENVSEILRIFLEAYGGDIEVCESLRTHPFQAHPPHIKAAVLAFLINELNASTLIISEIDKTLENMSNYRKNKWIIEGKIRRLKFALGKKTGQQDLQINSAEEYQTRSSTRNNEENEDAVGDESVLLKPPEDEEGEISSNVNTLDLERQIEKLTKRQTFLRKKIISCSQRLRCMSLGQDRYRRFYWLLPHIGGIFVEGMTDSSGETSDTALPELSEFSGVKNEEEEGTEDNYYSALNRSRGRPRKSEHCKYCQCPGSQQAPPNGLLQTNTHPPESHQGIIQTTVLSWLTRCQTSIMNSAVLTPENSPPHTEGTSTFDIGPCPGSTDTDEKDNRLFNSLLRTPCTENSPNPNLQSNTLLSPSSLTATTQPIQVSGLVNEQHQPVGSQLPSVSTVCQVCNKPKGNVTTRETQRGRPSSKLFTQIEQKYYNQLIERPIPENMKNAWWWIKDPVVLESLLKALHPRGIREKSLHKPLTKHLAHLKEMCTRPITDALFQFKPTEGHPVSQETLDKWSVEQRTFQVDISVLQRVEDLEQRVMMSDLQLRGWTPPGLDSIRSDLKYYEHKVEASDDILAKVKREGRAHREPDNPLDIAVLRLLDLEQNVERRYLKEPLWILSEVQHEKIVITDPETSTTTETQYSITSRLRLWHQTVDRCRNSAQLSLCLQQLEKSLAWERSVNKVTCIYCRKGDNDDCLLLCDSCDRGCHTYCHRPPITDIPEGDWFCPNCISLQGESEYLRPGGSSKRFKKSVQRYQDNSPLKQSRRKEPSAVSQPSPAEASLAKRKRIGTRSQCPDLTFCEIILMEMESHDDAWPFLEPVNPRLVPGYRKIIKNPMDFSTMRNKLLNGRYSSCKEFAEDAELVFSNCQLFNEDDSEVGKAGLVLKKFYESRWEEFNQEQENNSL